MKRKYLVMRRDGSIPKWPSFVLAAADPAATAALHAYANEAEKLGMDSKYVRDVRALAQTFEEYPKNPRPDAPDQRSQCEFVVTLMDAAASRREADSPAVNA
jgi:hypothetical protein